MSTATRPVQGTFCWNELMTPDAKKALSFYSALFGWTTETMDMGPAGTYTMVKPKGAEHSIGGVMEMKGPEWKGIPPHWMSYVYVEDIEKSVKQAQSLGGSICVPVTPIPNIGRFAIIEDPTGAKLALFEGGRQE